LVVGFLQGCWVLILLFLNHRVKRHCRQLTGPDKKTYDDIWEDMISKEGEILKSLCQQVMFLQRSRDMVSQGVNKIPRQLKMDGSPVQSLDHLYAQSAVLE